MKKTQGSSYETRPSSGRSNGLRWFWAFLLSLLAIACLFAAGYLGALSVKDSLAEGGKDSDDCVENVTQHMDQLRRQISDELIEQQKMEEKRWEDLYGRLKALKTNKQGNAQAIVDVQSKLDAMSNKAEKQVEDIKKNAGKYNTELKRQNDQLLGAVNAMSSLLRMRTQWRPIFVQKRLRKDTPESNYMVEELEKTCDSLEKQQRIGRMQCVPGQWCGTQMGGVCDEGKNGSAYGEKTQTLLSKFCLRLSTMQSELPLICHLSIKSWKKYAISN